MMRFRSPAMPTVSRPAAGRAMKPFLLMLLIWLRPGAALAEEAWPQDCKLHHIASLPMARIGGLLTVPVMVNGVEKHFLVDTGGYMTSISQGTATAMGLKQHDILFDHIKDAGGKEAAKYVYADTFRLGAMEAKNFDLVVDRLNDSGIDGTLAPDLLRNFDLDFDFAANTLNLFRPHACEGRAVYWTKDYVALPMDVPKSGHARIEVTLDGEEMDAILDTGATFSVMTFGSARRFFGLKPDSKDVVKKAQLSGGQGSMTDAYSYPFKSLSMGEVAVSNPKLLLADAPTILADEHVSLILGMSELHYLHLYFAYHEHKLYISTIQAR
jgi:predicted aspartyl protease